MLLSSCVDTAICRTTCGMELDYRLPANAVPAWTCPEFQRAENDMLEIFSKTLDFGADQPLVGEDMVPSSKEKMCKGLSASRVYVQPTPNWIDPWGRNVAGITYCPMGNILIGAGTPHQSSLTHEMAHWIGRCYSSPDGDYHHKWQEYGIYKAIDLMWGKEKE